MLLHKGYPCDLCRTLHWNAVREPSESYKTKEKEMPLTVARTPTEIKPATAAMKVVAAQVRYGQAPALLVRQPRADNLGI